MLFHEALHLIFTTFSRSVLREGRLTNYLADCGVFDMFDDKRTICQLIDRYYGVVLFDCLSHSPYKASFDAMLLNAQRCHPELDGELIAYIFHSVRYAWGKIKSVRPPKVPVLFAPVKKKRSTKKITSNQRGANGKPKKRPIVHNMANKIRYKPHVAHGKRPVYRTIRPMPIYRPTPQQVQKRTARVVLYFLALIFLFCSTIMYNANHSALGTIFLLAAGICFFVIYKYLN